MPANIAALVETHLETFLRMQLTGQTQAAVDSVVQRPTCAIKTRINNLQPLTSAITAFANTHLLKSISLITKRQERWQEIIDNAGDVAATVSLKILD